MVGWFICPSSIYFVRFQKALKSISCGWNDEWPSFICVHFEWRLKLFLLATDGSHEVLNLNRSVFKVKQDLSAIKTKPLAWNQQMTVQKNRPGGLSAEKQQGRYSAASSDMLCYYKLIKLWSDLIKKQNQKNSERSMNNLIRKESTLNRPLPRAPNWEHSACCKTHQKEFEITTMLRWMVNGCVLWVDYCMCITACVLFVVHAYVCR